MKVIGHNNKIVLAGGKALQAGESAPFLFGTFTHTSGSGHTITVPRLCSNVIVMLKSGVPTYNNVFAFLHYADSTASQHGMYARQGSSNVTYAAGNIATFTASTIVVGSTYQISPGDYYWIAW